ncbi:SMI1/KNR4 family protein [Streptosporangium roseum]|uniref:SMI1/KNR4 family protein n=1 Tax=Streptosporangium roseum TaxID=2001 RepID=UPI0012DC43E9|nr:SMI1/KNR4 family protein [Streptosporangium roseum]
MLRLITSRWVRLALVAAAVAAIVVAVLRLRRSPAVPGAALRAEIVPGSGAAPGSEAGAVPAPSPQWPPAPILGTPTADDLKHYATGAYMPRFLTGAPPSRAPLDDATRRRLTRWGAVAVALCLLVFATQLLETSTFSKDGTTASSTEEEYTEEHFFAEGDHDVLDGRDCMPASPRPGGWFAALCKKEAEPERAGSGGGENAPTFQDLIPLVSAPEERAEGPDTDCAPVVRTPVARKVSPRVTRAVNRQWARIERWLKANAPASRRTLRGPARARTIAVAEAQMGLRFPNDLRASLLRHNGAAAVGGTWPFGFLSNGFLGVREIRDTWRGLCEVDGESEGSDPRTEWWDGRMIPFGSDGSGNHLVVDSVMRDVGKTDHEGQMSFTPGGVPIRSHYALLKAVADAMETGGAVGHWKPGVTEGEFDWDVVN